MKRGSGWGLGWGGGVRVRCRARGGAGVAGLAVVALLAGCAGGAAVPGTTTPVRGVSPDAVPVGKEAVEALEFPELRFESRRAERFTLSNGAPVYYVEDRSLPLITLIASFKGGPAYFDRSYLAAGTAMGSLLLTGGTTSLPPDSVDQRVEFYALAPSAGSGGSRSQLGISSLTKHFDIALALWADILRHPRFDSARVEIWRTRELDRVRRFRDLPNSVAITEFNRVMFGDHPVGWVMNEADLTPERLSIERLRRLHREIFCPENMMIGVTGDIARDSLTRLLESALAGWPSCPRELGDPPAPMIRHEGGVRIVHKQLNQSTVILGQAGGVVKRNARDYYASQIANWILGAGGMSSRLFTRLRTREGLAYQAWSVWTTGTEHERVFGAFTQTQGENTIAAARGIRDVIAEMRREPPTDAEVDLAIESSVNGFVFAFEEPADVVARQMAYRAAELPEDWLERYIDGIQDVTPAAVRAVMRRYIRPDDLVLVVVGDTTRFDVPPDEFGPVIPEPSASDGTRPGTGSPVPVDGPPRGPHTTSAAPDRRARRSPM